jgi:hypothetical protein
MDSSEFKDIRLILPQSKGRRTSNFNESVFQTAKLPSASLE